MERKQIDYAFYHVNEHIWRDSIHNYNKFNFDSLNNEKLIVIFDINRDQSNSIKFIFKRSIL